VTTGVSSVFLTFLGRPTGFLVPVAAFAAFFFGGISIDRCVLSAPRAPITGQN